MLKIQGGDFHFWQWDVGRRLIVDDPGCSEVHFSNGTTEKAPIVDVRDEDGIRVAVVPALLLQTAKPLTAYAVTVGENGSITKVAVTFQVYDRPVPDDYVCSEDEIKRWSDLDERVSKLEKGGTTGGGEIDPGAIKEAVDEYLESNPPASGPQGEPGKDGTSPTVDVTSIDGGYRVTITDVEGGKTFDVLDGKDGQDGADGKTPVKGEDYLTPDEVQDIAEQAAQLVEVPDSGGLTKTEKDLIITLLRNGVYTSDVADSLTQLKTIWGYVYNITDYSTIQGYPGATVGAGFGGTTEGGTTIYFPVVEGSTYTISRTTTLLERDRFRFAFSETEPASNVVTLWYQNSDLQTNVTITAPANARYLMVYVGGNSYPTIPDGFTVTEE